MAAELTPSLAASLAVDVYDVNSGNDMALKIFMKRSIFAQAQDKKTTLNATVGGRIFRATNDAFGLCVLGAELYQNDLFLIFRGTTTANNKADFVTDARIGITISKTGLPVHIGFNHAFNSMLPEIRQFITEAKITGTVHCVGHSLGGAVASLAADWVAQNTALTVKLYTFGSPRVGTDMFVKRTTSSIGDDNMHRVYHRTDPVPMVPFFPFMHAPYAQLGHFIYSAQPLTSGAAHFMANYLDSVTNKSWAQLSAAPDQPYGIEAEIESWLKSKSPVNSSSPSFWRWVDSALIYVLKKIAVSALITLQGAFIGLLTLADKVAYILAKGIDLAEKISVWVERLMRKLMQALGMKVAKTKKELTRDLIRKVLISVTEKANRDARNALKNLK